MPTVDKVLKKLQKINMEFVRNNCTLAIVDNVTHGAMSTVLSGLDNASECIMGSILNDTLNSSRTLLRWNSGSDYNVSLEELGGYFASMLPRFFNSNCHLVIYRMHDTKESDAANILIAFDCRNKTVATSVVLPINKLNDCETIEYVIDSALSLMQNTFDKQPNLKYVEL